ncbi:MAG TPA: hypothetical protein VIT91_04335 [Chthoniobacterales bacterium]
MSIQPPFAIDLSNRSVLIFRGADRVRYLNGQLSNDVRKLQPDKALHACVMNAKGKMNADVWLALDGDTIRVDGPPQLSEELVARFERYIVADDVEIENVTGKSLLFHIIGASVEGTKSARFGTAGVDIFERPNFPILTSAQAESFRIEQGIPAWGTELTEDTLPPEAGLDADSIDYHKGCYIGQEVISRIKSVGRVNRHLVRISAARGTPLQPGTRLFAGSTDAGVVTSSAPSLDLENTVALAYLKRVVAVESGLKLAIAVGAPADISVHP